MSPFLIQNVIDSVIGKILAVLIPLLYLIYIYIKNKNLFFERPLKFSIGSAIIFGVIGVIFTLDTVLSLHLDAEMYLILTLIPILIIFYMLYKKQKRA